LMKAGGDPVDSVDLQTCGVVALLTKPVQRRSLFQFLNMQSSGEQVDQMAGMQSIAFKNRGGVTRPLQFDNVHILLVEDNLINQDVAVSILQKNGVEVDAVNNGLEALQALEKTAYDMVLMDMQMPEMDGLQATRLIRDVSSAVLNHQIPIVAMTANAMRRDQEACLQAGMDDYLSKPFNPTELMAKISRWTHPVPPAEQNKNSTENPKSSAGPSGSLERAEMEMNLGPLAEAMPGPAALDFVGLCERVMNDREMALDLIRRFTTRLDRDLVEMGEALSHREFDRIKKMAHKLKGSAAQLSAEPLRKVCQDLETAGAEEDAASFGLLEQSLRQAVDDFRKAAARLI
jgi:two-component system, sensor histidine kinase and response regulator